MTTKTSQTAAFPKDSQKECTAINLVELKDVLTSLAHDQKPMAMVDIAMSVLSQASKTIDDMNHEMAWLRKTLFGRRSEKIDPNQVSLFAQAVDTAAEAGQPQQGAQGNDEETVAAPKVRKKRKVMPEDAGDTDQAAKKQTKRAKKKV